MQKIFSLLNKYIGMVLNFYGLLMIIWGILSYFDVMPFYQVKLYKVTSITPVVNLFPGQKIRLNFDSHQAIARGDIDSLDWQLLRDNFVLFEEKGLEPTISLPLTEGGIYQLRVNAILNDKSKRTGQTNIYVVQDTSKQVTIPSQTQINLSTENNSSKFLNNVQSNGAEVYAGKGQWKKVETTTSENKVAVKLESNESIASFNNEMLIRAQGSSPKDLGSYGTARIPFDYKKPIN